MRGIEHARARCVHSWERLAGGGKRLGQRKIKAATLQRRESWLRAEMSGRLEGRVAIVTGASSGIGRATARALAREGAHLVIVGRDAGRLQQAAAEIEEIAPRGAAPPLLLALDVRRECDMHDMAEVTLERHGRIDILVNSAGILRAADAPLRTVAQMPIAEWDEPIEVNLTGTFLSNRAVLPAMIRQRSGDILNLSSKSGLKGLAFDAPYCASKFGVIGLSEALADEARRYGVRVQVVLPGPFESGVWEQTRLPQPGAIPPADRVAEVIVEMLSLPPDVKLVVPVVEPASSEAELGWRGGSGRVKTRPERPAAGTEDRPTANVGECGEKMLQDKVVLVTGAMGGIGLAACKAVAAQGAAVVMGDVDEARVKAAAKDLEAATGERGRHLSLGLDVREESGNEAFVRAALERHGRIDALIACAGILRMRGTPPKPLVKVSSEEWDQVLDVNLKGTFLSNRAVLPTLIEQRSGMILNVSSVSGLEGRAHDGPYCASKFGVIGLSQAVADEVKRYGIKVQVICPHAVDTPMWEQNRPVPKPGDAMEPERVADLMIFMLTQPADTVLVGPVIAPLGARVRKAST